jgi:hypothetical protein
MPPWATPGSPPRQVLPRGDDFLLFDIEIAFLYPWALALRELRWTGFFQLIVFFAILLTGYIYVWRKGVFNWGHEGPINADRS